jgi:predicted DNA-binding protein YlxM (UPF0122 family)
LNKFKKCKKFWRITLRIRGDKVPEKLSLNEIEENFPLSKMVIYRWIKNGKLNTKEEDGEIFVRLKDINNLLGER